MIAAGLDGGTVREPVGRAATVPAEPTSPGFEALSLTDSRRPFKVRRPRPTPSPTGAGSFDGRRDHVL